MSAPDIAEEALSGRFDEYEILGAIGKGGMATVYRAEKEGFPGALALKVLDRQFTNDEDILTKFLREGRVLQKILLEHPDAPVVRVVKFGRANGEARGRPFIAMEFIEGRNLLDVVRIRGQAFHEREALEITREIATGLAAAHDCGVYHRDLTPDNVIVLSRPDPRFRLKLIDFGVARHEFTSRHTLDGSIFGKPPYMSPEQCRGDTVDGRSDLYSLGVILYLLLTGTTPFSDPNPLMVMKWHQDAAVPEPPRDLTFETREVLMTLLAKRPQERFPTAHDLSTRLSKILQPA